MECQTVGKRAHAKDAEMDTLMALHSVQMLEVEKERTRAVKRVEKKVLAKELTTVSQKVTGRVVAMGHSKVLWRVLQMAKD